MTITKLRGAEYLLRSVADGVEDYFTGAGEAPGVWHGRWANELGLTGVVGADDLRALVEGRHPHTGVDMLAGHRERTVKAIDLTMSAPKSVSLLWAFGGDEVAAEVSIALVEAATTAVDFMERHAAVARQQRHGVRRRVDTHGLAVAMFTHRTSRDGDPQLHVHSLVPNLVQRADGTFVAVDANPVHEWLKASGTIFQSELQRHLTDRLGVAWGPERNGCREMIGFTPEQRRAFSKRTRAIETVPAAARLRRTVCHQTTQPERPDRADVFAALVDPDAGLCANRARFGHAHVVERVAALSGGRLNVTEIEDLAAEFLRTELVVRLVPSTVPGQRKPPEWSTLEHRELEDRVLRGLADLQFRSDPGLLLTHVDDVIAHGPVHLGADQQGAVRLLCGPGPGLRVVLALAGHGKTALTATAAEAMTAVGRPVVALATTNKAVVELGSAGLDALTIARFRLDDAPLAAGSVVILDEVSQVSTRDAHAVLSAVSTTPGAVLWCLGDDDQGRPVQPGGLATELRRLADQERVAAAELTVNRRQRDPGERAALAVYRGGDIAGSQAIRDAQGWEHDHETPAATREALANAAVADADRFGADRVTVLAVSHADCEDLADRIRAIRIGRGELAGRVLQGPGWGPNPRRYAAGDRILFHTSLTVDGHRFTNGTAGTIAAIHERGAVARLDDGTAVDIPAGFVRGERIDGNPNMSHGWARTIDGAQGGTWEQAHVLANPNLDRLTTYVGQSRGQRPTHTWSTTQELSGEEHGNVVVDPREKVWEGGISLFGGIRWGGVLAAATVMRTQRVRFWPLMDAAAPGLALGIAVGRIGDLIVGDHLGQATAFALGFRCTDADTASACIAPAGGGVHMPALYDLVNASLLLAVLVVLRRRTRWDGFLIIFAAGWYGLGRFLEDFFRIDDPVAYGLSGSQLTALTLVVLAGGWLVFGRRTPPAFSSSADEEPTAQSERPPPTLGRRQ